MLTRRFADAFAHAWIKDWNSRDLARILLHYADDMQISSPFIKAIVAEPTGTLRGKKAVTDYWTRALAANPQLHFTLLGVSVGASSITLRYRSIMDLIATEYLELNAEGKITRVVAHYNESDIEQVWKNHAQNHAWLWVSHVTPILNVSDFPASVAWFAKLGFRKCWEWGTPPGFGAVGAGEIEIFLCHDGQGGRGKSDLARTGGPGGHDHHERGVWMSLWVDDVDAVHKRCIEQGLDVTMEPTNEVWGVREMHVRHPDGHVFRISKGLSQP